MSNWNVLKYNARPRYYLTNPFTFFKETKNNLCAAWHRITRGYANIDAWNMNDWMLAMLPQMLRALAKDEWGAHPCNIELEDWKNWLNKTANTLELLQEENWEKRNEYAEDFYELSERFRQTNHDEYGNLHVTWTTDADYEEVKEKFFARSKELANEHEKLRIEVFTDIAKHLPELWS